MSSLPGHTLEAYLGWAYGITIEDEPENNPSLGITEALGMSTCIRPTLTSAEFAPIVAMFEEYRELIEYRLDDFDEDNQSWRDYAGASFGFITEDMDKKVFAHLESLKQNTGKKMSFITKEIIQAIKSQITTPHIFKGLCDAIALITTYSNYETPDQSNLVKARVSTILRSINTAILPTPFEYMTGYGLIARYLREHLAVEELFANELNEKAKLVQFREELDKKFNYNPNNQLDNFEWKEIIKELIDLNIKYFSEESINTEELWKQTHSTSPITETGLYAFNSNTERMIGLVFSIPHPNFENGIQCTISLLPNQEPIISVYHEWEERNVNIFNICFFPGMYKLILEEIGKLAKP